MRAGRRRTREGLAAAEEPLRALSPPGVGGGEGGDEPAGTPARGRGGPALGLRPAGGAGLASGRFPVCSAPPVLACPGGPVLYPPAGAGAGPQCARSRAAGEAVLFVYSMAAASLTSSGCFFFLFCLGVASLSYPFPRNIWTSCIFFLKLWCSLLCYSL